MAGAAALAIAGSDALSTQSDQAAVIAKVGRSTTNTKGSQMAWLAESIRCGGRGWPDRGPA